jgi:hypothetical protein
MSDRAKVGAGLLAVAAAAVLFVVLQGDDSSESTVKGAPTAAPKNGASGSGSGKAKPEPVLIRIEDGKPVGGVREVEVTSGERVRFRVISDTDGEVHVHGYDDEKPVAAGGSVSFDFPASIEGGYEIELHAADGAPSVIGELKVQPG